MGMDTLNLSDRFWKGPSETSPQQGGGVGQPFRQSTTWRAYFPTVKNLLARVRRIHVDRSSQVQRWIFSRESRRIAAAIPVTISGIDEHGGIFREATRTIDVSRRGARIATSNALAVGTYLRIESPSMEKPAIAQVARYGGRSRPDSPRDICVALLDVDKTNNIWGIKPPPEDWLTGLGEPSSAQRLEQVLGSEWAARFNSISNVATPPTGFAKGTESQHKPWPASRKPKAPPSSSDKWSEEGPVSVTSQPGEPVHVSSSTFVRTDEGVLSGPDQIRKVPTSDVEERLTGVSLSVEALEGRVGALVEDFRGRLEGTLQAFQGKGARQAEDLEKIAQDLGGRWSQQFQEQAEAAVKRLREELKNSGRVVEESKQQLASLAKAKLVSLSQVADNAASGFEAEQRRLKNQYETSRRGLEALLERGWTKPPSPSLQHGIRPKRRGIVAQLALVAGVCLVIMVSFSGVYLSRDLVMQLQPEAPAEFIEQSPNWSAKRRAREEEMAQAYWRVAVVSLQERYPFGSELPAEPPTEFQVDKKYVATGGAKAFSETRALYWENLRRSWVQRQSWVERHEWNTQWAARLRHVWDKSYSPK